MGEGRDGVVCAVPGQRTRSGVSAEERLIRREPRRLSRAARHRRCRAHHRCFVDRCSVPGTRPHVFCVATGTAEAISRKPTEGGSSPARDGYMPRSPSGKPTRLRTRPSPPGCGARARCRWPGWKKSVSPVMRPELNPTERSRRYMPISEPTPGQPRGAPRRSTPQSNRGVRPLRLARCPARRG